MLNDFEKFYLTEKKFGSRLDSAKAAWNHQQDKINSMNVQIAQYDDELRKCKKQVKFLTVSVVLLVMVLVGVVL